MGMLTVTPVQEVALDVSNWDNAIHYSAARLKFSNYVEHQFNLQVPSW